MVGNGGAKEFRRMFLSLSAATFTSMEFWMNESLNSIKAWKEALADNEGADD